MNTSFRLGILVAVMILIGTPAVSGNTLCVNTSGGACTGNTYYNITAALTVAQNGDTIIVGPGTYNEKLSIAKSVTLNGATSGRSKKGYVVPDHYTYDNTTESIIAPTGLQGEPVVTISSGDVTFDGFIVKNTAAIGFPNYPATYLISVSGTGSRNNIVIQNNVLGPVTNLTAQDGNAGRAAITVSRWSKSPTSLDNTVYNLKILNNKIFDAKGDGCGIMMIGENNWTGPASADTAGYGSWNSLQNQFKGAVIDNNEITGNHRSGIDLSGGVQGGPDPSDHIKITNNIISNNGWNSTVDKDNIKWGNGIDMIRMTNQLNAQLPWGSRYIDIQNNVFSGNEKNAIYMGPIVRDVTIANNIIQNNGGGTSPDTITGYNRTWDGVRIDLDETYQIEELARHPEQGTYSGHKIYNYLTNIVITGNKINGNGGYGLQVIQTPLTGPVDGRKNWWGTLSGPQNTALNPLGTGSAVSNNVRFSPWYIDNSETITRSAVSGDGALLIVGTGNFTTIQGAINVAWPGDTVNVFPGAYDERIVINRSLTLLGATSGISKKDYAVPAGYAYDATKESIIKPLSNQDAPVVTIETGSVIFDGFVVVYDRVNQYPDITYPSTHLIALTNQSKDYSDVLIENNVIGPNTNTASQDGTKGRAGIAVYGPSAALVRNLTIARNKIFDAKGDGCGILLLGSVNSTNQVMTSTLGLAGKYRDSLIDSNNISGNHRSGIEFSGGVQGGTLAADHFRITNNTIANNGWNSTVDRNNLKYGNGITLIHVGSDKENQYSWGSQYLDIDNNLITGNEKNGIYMGPINRNITITNNAIKNNGAGTGGYSIWDGVRVDLDESYHNPSYKNYGFLSNITVRNNEVSTSGDYGLRVIETPLKGSVDARNNWWGSASGPAATRNPPGSANNVSDNVAFAPWYTNPLKTTTSSLFPAPIATFTASPVEDVAGHPFSFDASSSAGQSTTSIQTYQWDFGDGNTSAASASPLTSWVYNSSRVFTITLTVKDFNGMTNQTTRQVSVIAQKEVIPLSFNGTTVSGAPGAQEITVDNTATTTSAVVTNSTTNLTIINPGNGWDEIVVTGNTTGGGGAPVTVKNITEVVLKAKPSVTTLDTTASDGTAGPGAVTTSLQLSLKQFANAPLQVEVTQGANATISNAFQLAAGSGNKVDAVAYTMTIKGSDLINSNLSAASDPVILNMSVSEDWVRAHGGISAIKVIRFSDDGTTKETLDTQYLFTAGTPLMCYFKIVSPHGCSIFGVTSVSAVISSSSGSNQASSSSSPSGGSESESGGVASSQKSQEKNPLAPPQPTSGPAVIPQESPVPVRVPETLHAPPEQGTGNGQAANVPGPAAGEGAGGLPDRAFAFIRQHPIPVAAVGGIVVIGTGLLVWWWQNRGEWL